MIELVLSKLAFCPWCFNWNVNVNVKYAISIVSGVCLALAYLDMHISEQRWVKAGIMRKLIILGDCGVGLSILYLYKDLRISRRLLIGDYCRFSATL